MRRGQAPGHEEALLAQIARRDPDAPRAFEALYDRYSGPVYSLARAMLRDAALAQEIVQDVFLGIWHGAAEGYDARRGTVRSWILALAHHKSVDAVRRLRLRTTVPLSPTMLDETDVVEEALRTVEQGRIRDALGALSPEQRTAIVLAYYRGLTQQEIADRLAAPLGTVKTRIRDGLLRLRAALAAGSARETAR